METFNKISYSAPKLRFIQNKNKKEVCSVLHIVRIWIDFSIFPCGYYQFFCGIDTKNVTKQKKYTRVPINNEISLWVSNEFSWNFPFTKIFERKSVEKKRYVFFFSSVFHSNHDRNRETARFLNKIVVFFSLFLKKCLNHGCHSAWKRLYQCYRICCISLV